MSTRRLLGAAVATLLLVLAAAPAAFAHAQLEGTSPARGATLNAQPKQVVFRFDEPVEGNFGAVRVFDAKGARVDDDRVGHPAGAGKLIGVGLKPSLPHGTYTATYRVISADGHPVSGGLVFSIGAPGAAPSQTVGQLIGKSGAGPGTQIAFGVARGLDYLAAALALGTLLFLLACWRPALAVATGAGGRWREASEAFAARAGTVLLGAVNLGLLSGLAGLVGEGATAGATSFWAAIDPSVVREVLGTRFGTIWGLRILDWVALGVVLLVAAPRRGLVLRPAALGAEGVAPAPLGRGRTAALVVPAVLLALAPALAGHASTQSPRGLLIPTDVVHVAAMSMWIGGLAALLFLVPVATRRLDAPDRTRLLAALLVRFSPIALACVGALLVTGTLQAYVHIRAWHALTDTAFGRAVLIKVGLILALIAIGAVNRRRVVPRLRALAAGAGAAPGAAGRLLRRTLRAEVALVVVVLGVTSALVSYAPPVSLAGGPVSAERHLGPLDLTLTVDPAQTGPNELHLYLFRAKDGTQFDGAKEMTVSAALPSRALGPLPVTVRKSGPGHYVADRFILAPGGDWKLNVAVRVSDFDEYTTTVKVPVR